MRGAGRVALAAQRATEQLRRTGIEKLAANQRNDAQRAASAPSAAAPSTGAAAAPSTSRAATPFSSAETPHPDARVQHDPYLELILAYSRLASLGLRQLAVYVERGPLATRQAGFAELQHLAAEEPRWAALRTVVEEALLVECDAALHGKLKALSEELHQKRAP